MKHLSWISVCIVLSLLFISPEGNVKKLFEGENITPELIAFRAGSRILSYFPESVQRSIDINSLEAMIEGEDKKESTDAAGWARYRRMQLSSDEKGTVKPNGWAEAQAARKALVGRAKSATAAPLLGGAGLSSSNWTWIGPGNQGGRIRSILVHPTVAGTLWIGSVGGGIWKSTNSGASWSVLQDSMTNLAITSLAMDSSGATTLYAATGEGFGNGDAIRGAGIFKSTDGGGSWSQLSSTNPASASADFYYVNRISAHPSTSGTLLAATQGGLYRSADWGGSWTKVLTITQMADVKYLPTNGNYALAGRGYYGGYVYYSSNGGLSWTPSNLTTTGRTEVAWGSGGVAYAVSDVNYGTVYRSTNYGATWTTVNNTGHLSGQGWYANAIWVNPNNNSEIIVGGLDLWRSTDSGASFSKISNWQYGGQYGSAAHADHHFIASMPTYNGSTNTTIYFANDGGMYRTDAVSTLSQYGTNWINLNNNLGITQFYGGAGHNGTNGRIVGGAQDNGDLYYTGSGTSWSVFSGGDGGKSAIDSTNGNYIYGEYVYLRLHRSTNGACCASDIISGLTDAGDGNNALFIAPFAIDQSNPNNMWAGGTSLWYTTSLKASTPSWSRAGYAGNYISKIALGSSSNVWFGTVSGALLNNTNALSSPGSFVSKASGLPTGRAVLSIFVDRTNANIVYVGYGGYNTGNIWKSTNGGTSWTNIHGTLPATPVYSIQTNPTNSNYIYIGTEVGVFTSEDGGTTWSTTNDGPANVSTQELFWLDNSTLVATTHGRGMFKTTVSTSPTTYDISYTKSGTGSGNVAFSPAGTLSTCSTTCTNTYATGTSVTLTATTDSSSTFAGWSGACSGTSTTCIVKMSAAKAVTATFTALPTYVLSYTKAGTGSGSVAFSSGSNTTCSSTCTNTYTSGTSVTLTATAGAGSAFASWSGACSGSSTTCIVTMSAAKAVTATFNTAPSYTLTYTKAGTGSGSVAFSSGSNTTCPSTCTNTYTSGTSVTLTATADSSSTFTGWSGACSSSTTTCVVTMSAAQSVTATFTVSSCSSISCALDSSLTWSTEYSNAAFFSQTAYISGASGSSAARSGQTSDSGYSCIYTTIQAPGSLSIIWSPSSETGYDYLDFYFNGSFVKGYSGNDVGSGTWFQDNFTITGSRAAIIELCYEKDSSASAYLDAGFVDKGTYARTSGSKAKAGPLKIVEVSTNTINQAGQQIQSARKNIMIRRAGEIGVNPLPPRLRKTK